MKAPAAVGRGSSPLRGLQLRRHLRDVVRSDFLSRRTLGLGSRARSRRPGTGPVAVDRLILSRLFDMALAARPRTSIGQMVLLAVAVDLDNGLQGPHWKAAAVSAEP